MGSRLGILPGGDRGVPGAEIGESLEVLSVGIKGSAQAMSLALGPVFVISGVAALLVAMTNRYGRVVDRTRRLLREGDILYSKPASADHVIDEIKSLYQRAQILRTSIVLASFSIFFVVVTVFVIFAQIVFATEVTGVSELCFMISLVVLLASLGYFIRDFMISLEMIKADINARSDADIFEDDNE